MYIYIYIYIYIFFTGFDIIRNGRPNSWLAIEINDIDKRHNHRPFADFRYSSMKFKEFTYFFVN